jgi:sucrose phosphorylase
VKNQVQLITYVDRLSGGGIPELDRLLQGPLQDLFGGVHLLPFYTPCDGADAGFDPVDHTRVDPRLGGWQDIRALAASTEVMADLIANHISRQSPQAQDYLAKGASSAWDGLLLTRERVFPAGASAEELRAIYRPRPGLPFSETRLGSGETVHLWTTFTPDQVDIDVTHPLGRQYLDSILQTFADNGVGMVRLDAVGYTIKKPGTACFMLPETFAYIDALSAQVRALGMEVLVEIHAYYKHQIAIAHKVDWVYDFALPPLILHAFAFNTATPLKHWLQVRPQNALTVLDTHDGIGIIDIGASGEQPGLVPAQELDALVDWIHGNCQDQSRLATGAAAANLDLYQVNCTYYNALGRNDEHYLLARAIQFFTPGIPQVYYMGLLAGENDMTLLARTGVGRDINRHYYSPDEVLTALARPVVKMLCTLIRLRNAHPAFQGDFSLPACGDNVLALKWQNGAETALLHVDFATCKGVLRFTENGRESEFDLLRAVKD